MIFLDEATIRVAGGHGGNGCVAFRREKFVPRGGPAGGDGGHGGDVWLVGDGGLNTLYHLRFRSIYAGQRGRHGEGSNRTGRCGAEHQVMVPLGTEVHDADSGELVGEVLLDGNRLLAARGGRGGRGNARFASPTRQAPRHAEPGEEGQERRLRLELKLLADVGVLGLPNAGKSTLIAAVSAARPKVADYPFTTLAPQLGVVADGLETEPFVIADLPGLIAGAAQGAGLGLRFLRHVERCRLLLHLVDLAALGDATEDLATVEEELAAFDRSLLARPRFVVGSKLDAVRDERREMLRQVAAERSLPYFEISSQTGAGVRELMFAVRRELTRMSRQPGIASPRIEADTPTR